ncbi:fimbrial protein [Pseudescherichia sp.]|uniref:fimbrial protein n=1 Tax=Pseudescherichia sp. TaxID=2055881 RepID=UPI00289A40B2|nr:fimbrial protein [Pseudescherichia sp.]
MHKLTFSLFILCIVFGFNCLAGQNSTIKVSGVVYVAACRVDPSSVDIPVDMGKHSIYQLKNIGDSTEPVSFSITLRDCPETTHSARVKMDGIADASNNSLFRIDNVADSATGIGVAIYDVTGAILSLASTSAPYNLRKGDNTLSFAANYVVSTLPVTNGVADATVDFTLIYQ